MKGGTIMVSEKKAIMRNINFSVVLVFVTWFLIIGASATVFAEDFPSKPFTYLDPYSAGGTADLLGRVYERFWEKQFGEPMATEYVTGAGGQVGWDNLVRRKPDGYVIAYFNVPHIILQPIARETIYTIEDFMKGAIAGTTSDPNLIAVLKDSKFKNIHDMIDYARKNPKSITVSVVGKFSADWLALKLLEEKTGVQFAEVVFPGSQPQGAALLGGHVDAMCGNVGDVGNLGPENIRVLAVAAEKVPSLLDPYLKEIGAPTARQEGIEWYAGTESGLAVPPNTPEDRIQFICEKVEKISKSKEFLEAMNKAGLPAYYRSRKEHQMLITQQKEKVIQSLLKLKLVEIKDRKVIRINK